MLHPTLRRCIFWAHLATGVVAGLIILILSVTGLLMSFETQIIGRAEKSIVREKGAVQTPLSPEALVAKYQASGIEGRPTSLSLNSDPEAPANFVIGRGSQQLFHPGTGESLGKGAQGTRRFFQIVLSLHRWITWPAQRTEGAQGQQGGGQQGPRAEGGEGGPRTEGAARPEGAPRAEGAAQGQGARAEGAARPTTWRDIGGNIAAIGTLIFFFLLVSGLFLWIPKKLAWRAFKPVLLVQPKLKGRARDWNWHNIAGFWASPFILLISLTGIIMFYPWANKLLFNAVGEQPPVRGAGGQGGAGGPGGPGGGEGGGARPAGAGAEGGPAREGGERRRRPEGAALAEGGAPEGGPRAEGAPAGEGRPPGEGGERRRRPEDAALAEGGAPESGPRAESAPAGEGRPLGEGGERRRRPEGGAPGAAGAEGSAGGVGGMARGGREGATPTGPIVATGLDGAAEAAKKFMPEWQTLSLELPSSDTAPFVATISDAGRGRPDRRVKLTLARDLSITKQETISNLTTGGKLRQFVRWTHTGEIGGWFGQLIAAFACAATIVLVWTGFALAWRRLASLIKKKKQGKGTAKKPDKITPAPTA